jgi:diketogulonate reductase-like aldo/keto reductase
MYGVDEEIGAAIRESGIPREEIFVTTKFVPHFAAPENVEICLDLCLKGMELDYVDLWLAHWPYATKPISREALLKAKAGPGSSFEKLGMLVENNIPVVDWEHSSTNIAKRCGEHLVRSISDLESNNQTGQQGSFIPTWKAMQALVKKGKARAIGVSNFSISELKDIIPYENDIPISCNQVEVHPWLPNNELNAFAKENGILTTCFSPFAGQKRGGATLLKDEFVLKLAEKNGLDIGQLLQSWAIQRRTVGLFHINLLHLSVGARSPGNFWEPA